jgi:hypothetical protein
MDNNRMPCPCCVFPGMQVRLDKKGRPFFQCTNCGTIIFSRLGEMGIQTVRHTLRLLESVEASTWVKSAAWQAAQQPGNVLALLTPAMSTAPIAVAPPVPTAAVVTSEPPATIFPSKEMSR